MLCGFYLDTQESHADGLDGSQLLDVVLRDMDHYEATRGQIRVSLMGIGPGLQRLPQPWSIGVSAPSTFVPVASINLDDSPGVSEHEVHIEVTDCDLTPERNLGLSERLGHDGL